ERPSTLTDLRIIRDAEAASIHEAPGAESERGRRTRGERGGRDLARPSPTRSRDERAATTSKHSRRARDERDASMDEAFEGPSDFDGFDGFDGVDGEARGSGPDPRERSAVTRPRRPERGGDRRP